MKRIEQVETEIETARKARDDCIDEISRLATIHRGIEADFESQDEATQDLEENYIITRTASEVGQERLTRSVVDLILGWKERQVMKCSSSTARRNNLSRT